MPDGTSDPISNDSQGSSQEEPMCSVDPPTKSDCQVVWPRIAPKATPLRTYTRQAMSIMMNNGRSFICQRSIFSNKLFSTGSTYQQASMAKPIFKPPVPSYLNSLFNLPRPSPVVPSPSSSNIIHLRGGKDQHDGISAESSPARPVVPICQGLGREVALTSDSPRLPSGTSLAMVAPNISVDNRRNESPMSSKIPSSTITKPMIFTKPWTDIQISVSNVPKANTKKTAGPRSTDSSNHQRILQTSSGASFIKQEKCTKTDAKSRPPCAVHVASGPSSSNLIINLEEDKDQNVEIRKVSRAPRPGGLIFPRPSKGVALTPESPCLPSGTSLTMVAPNNSFDIRQNESPMPSHYPSSTITKPMIYTSPWTSSLTTDLNIPKAETKKTAGPRTIVISNHRDKQEKCSKTDIKSADFAISGPSPSKGVALTPESPFLPSGPSQTTIIPNNSQMAASHESSTLNKEMASSDPSAYLQTQVHNVQRDIIKTSGGWMTQKNDELSAKGFSKSGIRYAGRLRDGPGNLQTGSHARLNEQEECTKIVDNFEPPCGAHVASIPRNSAQKKPGRGNNTKFNEAKEKHIPTRKCCAPPSNPASHKESKRSKPPCAAHVACDPSTISSASSEEGNIATDLLDINGAKYSIVQTRKRRAPSSTTTSRRVPERFEPSSSTANETCTLVDSYCWSVKEFEELWQNYMK